MTNNNLRSAIVREFLNLGLNIVIAQQDDALAAFQSLHQSEDSRLPVRGVDPAKIQNSLGRKIQKPPLKIHAFLLSTVHTREALLGFGTESFRELKPTQNEKRSII